MSSIRRVEVRDHSGLEQIMLERPNRWNIVGRNLPSRIMATTRITLLLSILLVATGPALIVEAFGSTPLKSNSMVRASCERRPFFPIQPSMASLSQTDLSVGDKEEYQPTSSYSEGNNNEEQEQRGEYQDSVTYETNLQIGRLAMDSARDATAAVKAHELLRRLENPETVTYNGVLKALAKSNLPGSALQAQELLDEMEDLYESQKHQQNLWYQRQGRSSSSDTTNSDDDVDDANLPRITVKPNVRTYSTVMDAWSHGKDRESAERAESLLYRLEDLYEQTGDESTRPNDISYNTVITAWAKSGTGPESARRAEEILQIMKDKNLADVISYNAVMHAWARSGDPNAGERAETLLRTMTDKSNVQPNARTYTTLIDAWSRSTADDSRARRAHALLNEMEDLWKSTGNERVKPNCISYSAVIHAYALSKEHRKATMACELLRRMVQLYTSGENVDAKPSLVTYNSVLNACATSTRAVERDEDGESGVNLKHIVRSIYKELTSPSQNLRPDHFTYGTILKACANLFCGEPDNPKFVQEVFERCCDDGQVSFGVCYQLRQAATSELYRSLIPEEAYNAENGHFSIKDMPKEWTRNVREQRRRYRQRK